jgi:RND family efflux transporter MFP subunit
MKPSFPAALLLILLAYAGCKQHTASQKQIPDEDTIPVKIMLLNQQLHAASIEVSGQFTTDDETLLSFKTTGVIGNIFVKEGDAVRKGQVLATLNLTEINAQVQQAQLAFEKAKRDHQRVTNLYNDSVSTLEQLQNSKTALDLALQQLNTAVFNRSYAEIRAPHDGYVLRKLANPGQVVSAGTAVLQTNGAHSSSWLLRVGISDREWAALQLNDAAVIQTTALPGQTFTGTVSRKSEGVDPVSGSFTADIRITGQKPAAIASGMFGKATIQPAAKAAAGAAKTWAVPYEALLDGDGSSGYVFITNDNKTARKVPVRIAGMEKNSVLISDGLQGAQALIISGSAYLTDNRPIAVIASPENQAK